VYIPLFPLYILLMYLEHQKSPKTIIEWRRLWVAHKYVWYFISCSMTKSL